MGDRDAGSDCAASWRAWKNRAAIAVLFKDNTKHGKRARTHPRQMPRITDLIHVVWLATPSMTVPVIHRGTDRNPKKRDSVPVSQRAKLRHGARLDLRPPSTRPIINTRDEPSLRLRFRRLHVIGGDGAGWAPSRVQTTSKAKCGRSSRRYRPALGLVVAGRSDHGNLERVAHPDLDYKGDDCGRFGGRAPSLECTSICCSAARETRTAPGRPTGRSLLSAVGA